MSKASDLIGELYLTTPGSELDRLECDGDVLPLVNLNEFTVGAGDLDNGMTAVFFGQHSHESVMAIFGEDHLRMVQGLAWKFLRGDREVIDALNSL